MASRKNTKNFHFAGKKRYEIVKDIPSTAILILGILQKLERQSGKDKLTRAYKNLLPPSFVSRFEPIVRAGLKDFIDGLKDLLQDETLEEKILRELKALSSKEDISNEMSETSVTEVIEITKESPASEIMNETKIMSESKIISKNKIMNKNKITEESNETDESGESEESEEISARNIIPETAETSKEEQNVEENTEDEDEEIEPVVIGEEDKDVEKAARKLEDAIESNDGEGKKFKVDYSF